MTRGRVLGAALTLAVVAALAWPTWPVLAVTPDGESTTFLRLPDHGRFGVTFVHSVDHLPVEDWYHVEDGRIVQDSTRLVQFGAGMGHMPGVGTGHAAGDWWEITGLDREIGDLVLRVGRKGVDHRLRVTDTVLPLSQCWAGARVTVRPARLSTLQLMAARFQGPRCTG